MRKEIIEGGCAGVARRSAGRARGDSRAVRAAVWLLVVLTAGAYLPTPLYPGYQHLFGFSDLTMTLLYATFALVSAPALLMLGPAAATLGPRAVLRASVVLAALGSGCFALAAGPGWLVAGRAAQGLALGAATGAATTAITNHAPAGDRARASLPAGIAFVAGTAAGPVVAGLLAQYLPGPRVLPYGAHLVLLAAVWPRLSALPGAGPRARRGWRPTRPSVPAALRGPFATAAATGFLVWAAAGLFLAVVPAVLNRAARIDNLAITGGIAGAVLACSVLSQPLVPRCGHRLAQLLGLGAVFVGLGVLAADGGSSVPVTMFAALTAGTGHGLAYGGATAAVDAATGGEQRAAINAALYLAFYLGAAGPAIAVGLLTLYYPLPTAIAWLSAFVAALVPLAGVAIVLTNGPAQSSPAVSRAIRKRECTQLSRDATSFPE